MSNRWFKLVLTNYQVWTILLLLCHCGAQAQITISRAEYFFDGDPGTGNGTSLTVTPGSSINQTYSISVASLSNGFHTLSYRVLRDSVGKKFRWSLAATRLFYIVSTPAVATASNIKKAEYFFDSDPGTGKAMPLSISPGATQTNTFYLDISSLTSGFHQLSIRYQDNLGYWSLTANRTFYIVPAINTVNATAITKAEYFFDIDPGLGSATSVSIASGATQNNLFAIDISSLSAGFHQLGFRYKDNKGHWSLFANRTFYIVPPINVNPVTSIVKSEYFFDVDPGTGKGMPIAISASATENNNFALDISSLQPGFHQLAIRYQDNLGRWSMFTNRTFYIVPQANINLATSVIKAEYFFDTDPGPGKATTISIAASGSQNNNFALDISSLQPGFHQLGIRYQDNLKRWSTFSNRTFYIIQGKIITDNLQRVEYFIDTDPGVNKATPLSFTATPALNQVFTIDLGTTPPGNHMLYVRVKDTNGYWSEPVVSSPFTIASCTVPTAPIGTNGSRCDVGSVTLSASGAAGSQQYRWYADGTTNTISFTGTSYSTPSLNGNTDFYASVFDPSTGCESSRTKVSANVTIIPKPILNPSGSITLCQGNSFNISAPVGYASYTWSNSATTPGITVSTSANYSVTVSDGTCTSPASDPLVLTVVPAPAKPIVLTPSSTTICGIGTVTLTAPASASQYLWSDGSFNQQLVANTSGNYSVKITDSNNCQSISSDPVAVQILPVPNQPIISVTGSTTLCNNSNVVLSAPSGFTSYQWSTGATTQQIIVSAAGNYSVVVSNGNCSSVASNPIAVTAGSPPSKPSVQVFGTTTICGNGSVTLTAPAGAASYLWSNGSTTQQLTVSAAGNYSVQIIDANNCESIASDQVVVQVVTVPPKPVITPLGQTALCNNSSVILSAPAGFANYQWSDGAVTQQIVATAAGNYSVEVGNGQNCLSAASDPVAVSLTNLPCNSGAPPPITNPNYVPPAFASVSFSIAVGNSASFNLKKLITPGSYNVQFSSLKIVHKPASDTTALIDSNYDLILDYEGITFVGKDSIDLAVCDTLGACTSRYFKIEVTASIEVFNAVSPFPDGINDFFNLKYIDKIDETKKNKVTIVDRWGSEVFSISDYNNADRVFNGNDNSGKELPTGTYYYRIDFESGRPTISGFLSLKR
jgi:gliding motility-associated-like protein